MKKIETQSILNVIYLYQSLIYFLSRINAPAKRFGYTLTNQRAECIDSFFLIRIIFFQPFLEDGQQNRKHKTNKE